MKNEYYFPLEVNMYNTKEVSGLLEEEGVKGYGIYLLILDELRRHSGYACCYNVLRRLGRQFKIRQSTLLRIVEAYGLFELSGGEDNPTIFSPYLGRVMEAYDRKVRLCAQAGRKKADSSKRDSNGRFTSDPGAIEKEIEIEKNKKETTTAVVVKKESSSSSSSRDGVLNDRFARKHTGGHPPKPRKGWEELLDEAVLDEEWLRALIVHSGMGKFFTGYRQDIVGAFRQHVRLYATGDEIHSVGGIKSYFANYLRPGTPTHSRLYDSLTEYAERQQRESPYRHETIDPETGARSYFGRPIPPDAPPRPGYDSVWDDTLKKWG